MPTSEATDARVEKTPPAVSAQAKELMLAVSNASHWCGEHRDNDETPYGDLLQEANDADSALSTYIATLENNNRELRAALSDQEAAERVPEDVWGRYEALRDEFGNTNDLPGYIQSEEDSGVPDWETHRHIMLEARASLDAFVRRHIALAEARGAVPEEPVAWRCRTVNGLGWAYLTEHRQGVQMGPEWEPLYATTPRPASSMQAEGGGTDGR